MDRPVEGGNITNRKHFDRVAKQTKRQPEELYKLPEIEPELLYLYAHYCNIKSQGPLTFQEINAWTGLTGTELTPGEVDCLFVLDAAFYEPHEK